MSKFGITARIAAGFGAIIILLVVLSIAAIGGILTLSGVSEDYRLANGQSGEISDYVADYHQMEVTVRQYLLAPTAEIAEEARVWIDDVATNDSEGVAKFEPLPIARAEISKIEVSAAALRDAFDKLIALEEQRGGMVQAVSKAHGDFQPAVSALIEAAAKTNNAEFVAQVARVVKASLNLEGVASEYMNGYSQQYFDLVQTLKGDIATEMGKLEGMPLAAGLSATVSDMHEVIDVFVSSVEATAGIAGQIQKITAEELAVRAEELTNSYAILTSEVRSNQDALGPISVATASITMWVVGGIALIAVLAGLALAVVTGRWLSSAIGGMSVNMNRMADGDLDLDLGPKPKATELGLMAQALETFRKNGLAMRSMDAEKEQTREKERAEQAVRNKLQKEVGEVVSAAVAGDFTRRVATNYDDPDLRGLADAVNSLVETVDRGVGESGSVLSALASADLTKRVNGEYQGAFDKLKRDTNAVANELTSIVTRLRQTSRGLKTATGEILSGANDLSERTTKQAATIEETSAAMEQLATTVLENSRKAASVSDQAKIDSQTAEEGGQVMNQANQAMERISNSSAKISNIIGMIDDIAFQTNLLALNASVEAARAGEAGKGFAVVAVEVRRLAQSAGEASSEVKALIEQSGEEVTEGTRLVASATEKLNAMLESARANVHQMEQMAADSREQATSIEEVSAAVRQMDEMTQHNAALVEETNAAIEQTESQASELDRIVEVFTIDASSSVSASRASAPAPRAKPAAPSAQKAAKTYLSQGNAAIDKDWSEF